MKFYRADGISVKDTRAFVFFFSQLDDEPVTHDERKKKERNDSKMKFSLLTVGR